VPQAKLPDLNNYWIKYHDSGMFNLMHGNYRAAVSAIYNMNALLPKEYRLGIDTARHYELTRINLLVVCGWCNTEIPRNEIRVFNWLLPFIESVARGTKSVRVWICSKCERENELESTKFLKKEHEQPQYFDVIPEPPNIGDGLIKRELERKTETWFYNSLEQLDHKLGLYRTEYEPEGERDDVQEFEEE